MTNAIATGDKVSWIAKGKGARIDGVDGKRVTGTVVEINDMGLFVDGDYRSLFTSHIIDPKNARKEVK